MESSHSSTLELQRVISSEDVDATRRLIREYAEGLGVDLCFQSIDMELATLPGDYAGPEGALFLAKVDGHPAGCCALRPILATD